MAFTAKDVATLREKTGCGMMDCKKALSEADGNMDKAVEYLREKGLAAAAKKSGRIAAEGLVYAVVEGNKGIIIEVNSETDFVGKNEGFQEFVKGCAATALNTGAKTVEELADKKYLDTEYTVAETLREKILTIGENLNIRRFEVLEGTVASYIHGGGRIGVLVKFDTDLADNAAFVEYSKDIAMQIAAVNPLFCNVADVPTDTLDKEKEILLAQALNDGKPQAIAEKMVVGRIAKYYKEVCLTEQPFVKNQDQSVAQYTAEKAKELGGNISIATFVRFEKGEGIAKREDDFAAEVAKMTGN